MNVTQVNEKIGLLQASTAEEHSIWTGLYTANHWTFTIRNDTIYGMAKQTGTSKNAFGAVISTSETYYNDKVHRDHAWYWNVRNGLESLCEDQVIIWVEKK